jgi:crotonobetainyl-CoA hydratase
MTGAGSECKPAVSVQVRDHIAVLTINRPEVRNAINSAVTDELGEALKAADTDPDARVVIFTSAGRAFCVGTDLKALARGEDNRATRVDQRMWGGFAGVVNHPVATPVIAAVNGLALGGGTELVLAADLAVAAQSAVFGLPEVKRGIFAAAGGAIRIAAAVPRKMAMELLLTRWATSS